MAFVAAAAPYERTVSDDQWLELTDHGRRDCALRWRTRVTSPLPELLGQLAGNPVDLRTLRHDFAAALTDAGPAPRTRAREAASAVLATEGNRVSRAVRRLLGVERSPGAFGCRTGGASPPDVELG
jgi:hypothetical protein